MGLQSLLKIFTLKMATPCIQGVHGRSQPKIKGGQLFKIDKQLVLMIVKNARVNVMY